MTRYLHLWNGERLYDESDPETILCCQWLYWRRDEELKEICYHSDRYPISPRWEPMPVWGCPPFMDYDVWWNLVRPVVWNYSVCFFWITEAETAEEALSMVVETMIGGLYWKTLRSPTEQEE